MFLGPRFVPRRSPGQNLEGETYRGDPHTDPSDLGSARRVFRLLTATLGLASVNDWLRCGDLLTSVRGETNWHELIVTAAFLPN